MNPYHQFLIRSAESPSTRPMRAVKLLPDTIAGAEIIKPCVPHLVHPFRTVLRAARSNSLMRSSVSGGQAGGLPSRRKERHQPCGRKHPRQW